MLNLLAPKTPFRVHLPQLVCMSDVSELASCSQLVLFHVHVFALTFL